MNKDDSPFFEITDNISVLVNPTFLFNNIQVDLSGNHLTLTEKQFVFFYTPTYKRIISFFIEYIKSKNVDNNCCLNFKQNLPCICNNSLNKLDILILSNNSNNKTCFDLEYFIACCRSDNIYCIIRAFNMFIHLLPHIYIHIPYLIPQEVFLKKSDIKPTLFINLSQFDTFKKLEDVCLSIKLVPTTNYELLYILYTYIQDNSYLQNIINDLYKDDEELFKSIS